MDSIESSSIPATNAERDAQIRAEVAALAARHKDSRSLTLEVCRLLFYRFGEAPNANRVYNLTRRGSLTTITEQVAAFWQGLREQTRAHIPCEGLGAEAAEKLGGFLTGLITDIEQRLRAELDGERHRAQQEVIEARQAQLHAEAAARAATVAAESAVMEVEARALQAARDQDAVIAALQQELAGAQRRLAAESATVAHLREEVAAGEARAREAVAQQQALQQQQKEAQALFAHELAGLRQALDAAEARAAGAEQRALERIEEERALQRQLAGKLEQAEKARAALLQRTEDQGQALLDMTGEVSLLKGRQQALQEERDRLLAELRLASDAVARPTRRVTRPRSRPPEA